MAPKEPKDTAPEVQPELVRFESDYPHLVVFITPEYFVRFVDGAAECLPGDPAIEVLRACADVREVA